MIYLVVKACVERREGILNEDKHPMIMEDKGREHIRLFATLGKNNINFVYHRLLFHLERVTLQFIC